MERIALSEALEFMLVHHNAHRIYFSKNIESLKKINNDSVLWIYPIMKRGNRKILCMMFRDTDDNSQKMCPIKPHITVASYIRVMCNKYVKKKL